MNTLGVEVAGFVGIALIQLTFLVIFGIFVRYDTGMLPIDQTATPSELRDIAEQHRASYARKFCIFSYIYPLGFRCENQYLRFDVNFLALGILMRFS